MICIDFVFKNIQLIYNHVTLCNTFWQNMISRLNTLLRLYNNPVSLFALFELQYTLSCTLINMNMCRADISGFCSCCVCLAKGRWVLVVFKPLKLFELFFIFTIDTKHILTRISTSLWSYGVEWRYSVNSFW